MYGLGRDPDVDPLDRWLAMNGRFSVLEVVTVARTPSDLHDEPGQSPRAPGADHCYAPVFPLGPLDLAPEWHTGQCPPALGIGPPPGWDVSGAPVPEPVRAALTALLAAAGPGGLAGPGGSVASGADGPVGSGAEGSVAPGGGRGGCELGVGGGRGQ